MMNGCRKSDSAIVPERFPNKEEEKSTLAEEMEGRRSGKKSDW